MGSSQGPWEVRIAITARLTKSKPCLLSFKKCFFFLLKVSCPGVFLQEKQDVYLGVYLLNQYLETDCFPSVFPIVIQQSMRFEKVILTFSSFPV
jgi:hypothetical protein